MDHNYGEGSHQRIKTPLNEVGLQLEPRESGPKVILPKLRRAISWLYGRDGHDMRALICDPTGNLITRGPDFSKATSTRGTGSLSGGAINITLGGVYHFHQIVVEEALVSVGFGFSVGPTENRMYPQGLANALSLSADYTCLNFWASASHLQILKLGTAGATGTYNYSCFKFE